MTIPDRVKQSVIAIGILLLFTALILLQWTGAKDVPTLNDDDSGDDDDSARFAHLPYLPGGPHD